MKKDGEFPLIPPNPVPYLVDWLFEIGPVVSGEMGTAGIGWRDLRAWQKMMGVELLPWEALILRRLSSDYAAEMERAKRPDRAAPWGGKKEDVDDRRQLVGNKVDTWFRSMKGKKG